MKNKSFSRYYKIVLSGVIMVVLLALKEDYGVFDEMTGM